MHIRFHSLQHGVVIVTKRRQLAWIRARAIFIHGSTPAHLIVEGACIHAVLVEATTLYAVWASLADAGFTIDKVAELTSLEPAWSGEITWQFVNTRVRSGTIPAVVIAFGNLAVLITGAIA